jgi:hypothetical protein
MPKSRHSHRKKTFKPAIKQAPAVQAEAQAVSPTAPVTQKPGTEQYKTPAHLRATAAASAATRASASVPKTYPYVKKELATIGVLAVIILIILVVLANVL